MKEKRLRGLTKNKNPHDKIELRADQEKSIREKRSEKKKS